MLLMAAIVIPTFRKEDAMIPQATRFVSSLSVTAITASALSHPASLSISISVEEPQTAIQSSFAVAALHLSLLLSMNTTDFFSSIRCWARRNPLLPAPSMTTLMQPPASSRPECLRENRVDSIELKPAYEHQKGEYP